LCLTVGPGAEVLDWDDDATSTLSADFSANV